jgi:Tat protein translocase TatB subunit
MFLFILESLSFTELAVIGIIALVVLGPRRLPELARKAGKIMSEFRKVTSDFKETWEKEALLDDDTKQLLSNPFEYEDKLNSENSNNNILPQTTNPILAPEVKEVSEKDLQALKEKAEQQIQTTTETIPQNSDINENSKQNWL